MRLYITAVFIFFTLFTEFFAGVHFVSKTGSSSPPYSSWAAAADSIQKAVNVCKYLDTVYVGSGTYKEWVYINNGVTLIGSGMDSCIIDTREMDRQWATVDVVGSIKISGFSIFSSNRGGGTGISCLGNDSLCIIENNRIEYSDSYCITIGFCPIIIRYNIIISKGIGVRFSGLSRSPYSIIENNYFTGHGDNIYIPFFTKVIVRHNTFYLDYGSAVALNGSDHDTLLIYNNFVISKSAESGLCQSNRPAIRRNNLVFGNFTVATMNLEGNYSDSRNNISINTNEGIIDYSGNPGIFRYNNSWGSNKNYVYFTPDSTNMSVDPMFVNPDSLDFHLQMFSQMIDAGDPSILDVDGSRSDIGPYGGPYGESYTYKDLAPRTPRNVTGSVDENMFTLKWQKNTEADFAFYRIYRDTIPSFIPDSSKRFAIVHDTSYSHGFKQFKNYFFKVSAVDNQGNESPKSEEVQIITDVNDNIKVIADDYKLFPNYPNPFNPSTKISYRLLKPGYVKLSVYDIKGALVKELLNGWQESGYHEEEFTGMTSNSNDTVMRFASGVYLLKIEVKNESNIPVFTDMRKMMMVK